MNGEPSTRAIAVDAMGSDLGPAEIVAGVALARRNGWLPDKVVLVGREDAVLPALAAHGLKDAADIEILAASEVIGMDEKPIQSLRTKKDASLVRAVELVKLGACGAAVSCGNTGSLMACSTLKLRPIEGVSKPALASVWPRPDSKFIVLDVGANPQCRPENLLHYAILGNQYARDALEIAQPRVGLLSIGTEEGKGTELTDAAHRLLKGLGDQIHYIGLIEGFQLFRNEVDVVVTDGFTGNVILKTCEALWKMLKELVRAEVRRNPVRLAGAVLLRGGLRAMREQLDPTQFGGAPLLGLRGTVIKAHGSSNREALAHAIRIAGTAISHQLGSHTLSAITAANAALGGELTAPAGAPPETQS